MAFTLKVTSGKDFVDRRGIVSEMVETLSDSRQRMGFALYGRRRVGKSSILLEVKRRLDNSPGVVTVYHSLWKRVNGTVPEFVKNLAAAILDEYKPRLGIGYKARDLMASSFSLIKDMASSLKLTVRLKSNIEFMLSFDEGRETDMVKLVEGVFNLAEGLAKETKTRCVIMLDEFPEIMKLKNGTMVGESMIKLVRTIYERQENTVLTISGSVRSTMETVTLSPASAFYWQFVVKEVGPLEDKYVGEIITKNIEGGVSKGALSRICTITGGVPFYVQFIGRELRGIRRIGATDVDNALRELLTQEGNIMFMGEYEKLSPKEKKIVVDMAKNGTRSPSAIAKNVRENTGAVVNYLAYLEAKGAVRRVDGHYELEDPIFKLWVAESF